MLLLPVGCGAPMTPTPIQHTATALLPKAVARSVSNAIDTNGAEWPEFRRDDQRTGNNPYQTAITTANVGTLAPKWSKITAGVFASAVVVNGVVYEGDLKGKLYAWNIANGKLQWSFKSTGSFVSTPYYSNGTLYVGAKGTVSLGVPSKVYSINAATGAKNWEYDVAAEAQVDASPMLVNGVVYAGTDAKNYNKNECDSNDQMLALDANTGALVSTLSLLPPGATYTGADIWSSVALDPSGNMYVGTGPQCQKNADPLAYSDAILQVNPSQPTMSVNWSFQSLLGPGSNKFDDDFGATPLYVDGMVIDSSKDGYTYAVNSTTGAMVWDRQTGPTIGSSATDGTHLFVPSMEWGCAAGAPCGAFQALNVADGSVAWSIPINGSNYGFPELAAPVVSNGIVYASFNGSIWALNASTGATLWSYAIPNSIIFGGFTVVNGGVLVGEYTPQGSFFCFTPGGK